MKNFKYRNIEKDIAFVAKINPNTAFYNTPPPYQPVAIGTFTPKMYTHPNNVWALALKYTFSGGVYGCVFDILQTDPESRINGNIQ